MEKKGAVKTSATRITLIQAFLLQEVVSDDKDLAPGPFRN